MRIVVLSRNPALYSTSRLVLAGRARGHQVDVIDPLELQLVVARGEPHLHRAGAPLGRYHAVLPRIGASVTGYGVSVVRQFERQGVSVLNGSEAIGLARDKVRALAMLAQQRIAVPRTVCTRSLVGLDAALRIVGGCPAIVKLQHGAQGIGTMLADTPQALTALLETLWAMGQEIVLQEYVHESHGRDIRVVVVGGRFVAAMRRQARPGEFRSNLHRGGTCDRVKLSRRYRHCAIRAASLLGLDVAGVDMLEGRKGPMVIELNSSPGLEGIERAAEVDVATTIIELAEQRHAELGRSRRTGKRR